MASRAVAVVLCAFAPCSGFVTPVRVAGGGTPSLSTSNRPAARSRAPLPPCHMLSQRAKHEQRVRMVSTASSGRRRIPRGLRMMAGGEGGGCEMEGEIGEGAGSGAEPLPVAQTEGQNTAEVATGEESTPTIASNSESVTGSDSGSDSSLSSSAESSSVVASGGHGDEEESGRELHSADAAVDRGVGGLPAAAAATATTTTTTTGASAAAEVVETRGVEEAEVDGGSGDENLARHGEPLLPERDGFAALRKVLKVLPGGGEELEMDMERLRVIRSDMTKLKRNIRQAVEDEDYEGAGEMKKEVAAMKSKDPLCVVSDVLGVAVSKEKFKRAARLRAAKDWLIQESHESVFNVDRLVCLGNKASNVITTDPDGSEVRRYLGNDEVKSINKGGQIQLPVWSPDGRMLAFSVLTAGSGRKPIESARIRVYREGGGLALDVNVPRAPFLLMWSPNSQSLTYLSNIEGPEGPTIRLSEILVAAAESPVKTKSRGLAQGNPLFYAYTKNNPEAADMVVHTGSRVYFLDMATGKETDISASAAPLFMAPSTHCEGGKDGVILVEGDEEEGQHLVSSTVDGSSKKRLCPTRGFSTFGVSPDGRRVCLMQQDLTTGFYTISVLEGGKGALDPASTATMEQVEIPLDRVIMAFFFSPDSKKLLCLATKMSKSELAVARSSMRLGFQLKFQWVIFDCETRAVQMLEEFSPRQFFLKMYLPYFDMFAQGFTPWAPDSKSFAYVAAESAFVQEVPDEGLAPLPRELGPNMEFVSWSFC